MDYEIRRDGVRLFYTVDDFTDPWRKAPYIILQPGFGRYSAFWYRWVPYLSRFYKVVRPDPRWIGPKADLPGPDVFYDLDDLARDVIAIIDDLGADSVHYCGEALGGTLGMQIGAQYADRIRTLTLVAAPVFTRTNLPTDYAIGQGSWPEAIRKLGVKQWAIETNKVRRFPSDADPGLLDWYGDTLAKTEPEALARLAIMCHTYNQEKYLPDVKAPVLALYPNSRSEMVEVLRRHVKNFQLVQIDTRYHFIYQLFPKACAEMVLHHAACHDEFAPFD